MHITTVYVEPKDILNKLTEESKKMFNKCVFTDCQKMKDGTVNITCLLLNDKDESTYSEYRYKLMPSLESEEVDESEEVEKAEEVDKTEESKETEEVEKAEESEE